ncbi:MAG: phosphate/phosphite/phosphonate ABC transporter substrate-binding protein [Deltaproteobacteria bacterium]|nr:phosphate/phosphite/phosphonate ABC transporter substrate-binding protein [Deltaproteobacteria bacterium]
MRRKSPLPVLLALALVVPGLDAQESERSREVATQHFGVVNFYYPRMMYLKYQPLVDYLSEHTGRSWELRVSTTYQQTVDELCAGRLTAAYLGPYTYVRARAACGAEPLIRLQTGGRDTYQSYILVRDDSPVRELAELEGKRFGFGSAMSTSSHLVPRAMLVEAGIDLGQDMQCLYLGHHQRALRAVLLGEVDACGVRDIVGKRFLERGLRILARSKPIPNFPIVVAPQTTDETRRELLRVLVELPATNPVIARRMTGWDEELAQGFVPSDDADYDSIRALAEEVFGAGALRLSEADLRCSGLGQ